MLRDRCPLCNVGCIVAKPLPLGKEVGLGDIVLYEDQLPTERGTTVPTFRLMSIVSKRSPVSAIVEHLFIGAKRRLPQRANIHL